MDKQNNTTYSISQDIASGTLDVGKLEKEIIAANCVVNLSGIMAQGDVLQIMCDSVSDQPALDAVVRNHVAISLDDNRNAKLEAIDGRTDAIIDGGFDFDSNHFSLSAEAQTNWLGMATLHDSLPWPFEVTTGANIGYLLTLENLGAFIAAGIAVIQKAVSTGRVLKIQCVNAQTQADLDKIMDTR